MPIQAGMGAHVAGFVHRRSLLVGVAVGIPISVVLLLLSVRHLDAASFRASVAGADPWRLALAVAVLGVFYVTQAARWRLVAGSPSSVPAGKFLEWVVDSVADNNVVPGRRALARTGARNHGRDRGLDVATLVALLVGTYLAVPHPAWLRSLAIAAGCVTAMLLVVVAATRAHARRASAPSTGRVRRILSDLAHEVQLRLRGARGPAAMLLSLAVWGLWALSAWLVASSLGIGLSPLDALFVTAVLNLGVAVPSSPGYIGTARGSACRP